MFLYRLITGPDDAAFCARIERLLNLGWLLHGSPTVGFDGVGSRACQAVVKEMPGQYEGFVHLDELHRADV